MSWLNWRCLFGWHDWLPLSPGPHTRRYCPRCDSEQEYRHNTMFDAWHWRWVDHRSRET